jgi:hypothetical protein
MATKAKNEIIENNDKTLEEVENEVKPITLRFTDTDQVYVLEFDRNTVKLAERNGFPLTPFNKDKFIDEIDMVTLEQLFYYSFQMHNRGTSKQITDNILYEELGGMPVEMLIRLVELYLLPYTTLISGEGEKVKNSKLTIEM